MLVSVYTTEGLSGYTWIQWNDKHYTPTLYTYTHTHTHIIHKHTPHRLVVLAVTEPVVRGQRSLVSALTWKPQNTYRSLGVLGDDLYSHTGSQFSG